MQQTAAAVCFVIEVTGSIMWKVEGTYLCDIIICMFYQ
jgi:hypothetical protein